ncbi:hypothetical protein RY966_005043 [Enterobacter kobei]|nr:hypothetical protein [Enterobacter kobei]
MQQNLIVNGDFEKVIVDEWKLAQGEGAVEDLITKSSHCTLFDNNILYQNISLQPGSEYEVSFKYRGKDNIIIGIVSYAPESSFGVGIYSEDVNHDGSYEWMQFTDTFVVPENRTGPYVIEFAVVGPYLDPVAHIDDVKLIQVL